jgi:hypothetical protein
VMVTVTSGFTDLRRGSGGMGLGTAWG